MLLLCTLGACSLLTSLALTPFFRDFFAFLEMVDHPGNPRKLHLRPIPRVGGISIAISYFCALAAGLLMISTWKQLLVESAHGLDLLWKLLPALAIVFVTGLLDDFRGLTPSQKLGGQLVAAGCAYGAGIRFSPLPNHPQSAYWDVPLTILWLVFCANAFNLIDGLDGLASGVALLGASGLMMAAMIHHQPVLALAIAPFLGALLGFLYYNFNPASVFLGDCGSLLIGFLVGCFGLIWSRHAASGIGHVAPLLVMVVPAGDVGLSVARRLLRRKPIFRADRNHIHHRLLSLGMTHRDAAFTLWGVSALGATLAVLQTLVYPQTAGVLVVFCAGAAYFGIRKLRYIEFRSLVQVLGGELWRILRMRICLNEYQESLDAAGSLEECWDAVSAVCREAGFRHVTLEVADRRFELSPVAEFAPSCPVPIVIPLGSRGQVTFVRNAQSYALAMWAVPIVESFVEKWGKLGRTESPAPEPSLEELKPLTMAAP